MDLSSFKNHLAKYMSEEEINQLVDSFSLDAEHAVILNTKKMSDERFLELFPHVKPHPFVKHAYIYDKNEYELGKNIYHELGSYYIQEPSAMIVSSLLDIKEGDFILDLCAAPGGKTIGASLALKEKGIIISNDIAKDRCRALLDNVSRLGLNNVVITNNDFKYIYLNYLETFDHIILDAPCSGSGMFRKEEKMKEDWSLNKVLRNAMVQYELIDIAYSMLKKGGTLVYSTCSYSYEEDEEVIMHLLSHTDAEIVPIKEDKRFYRSSSNLGIHLFPYLFNGEGHYICLIHKPGHANKTNYLTHKQFNKFLPDEIKDFSSYKFGENIFALPYDFKYKGINIYNFGIRVGELIKNNEIIYSYELSHALSNYISSINLNDEEVTKYIQGEQLNKINPYKGNVLLTYQNIPLDFSKTNGTVLKNHYPKYLRKKVNI